MKPDKSPDPERRGDLRVVRELACLVWRQMDGALRRRLAVCGALVLAAAGLGSLTPVLFKQAVDLLGGTAGSAAQRLPIALLAAYIAVQAVARVSAELRWAVYGRIEQRVQRFLTLALFDHVHALSLRFHLSRRTGGLQQVVSNGLLGYRLILFHGIFTVLPLILELATMAAVLVGFYSPVFLVLLLATAALYIASFVIGVARQRGYQRDATDAYVDAFARVADSYLNYETIKYFAGERALHDRLDDALTRGEDGWSAFYGVRTGTGLVQAVWLTLGLGVSVTLAAGWVVDGTMSLGDFVLVNAYLLQLGRPLENLGFAYREVKTSIGYLEKLFELLDERPELVDPPGAIALPDGPGEIVFERVGFAYDERRGAVLDEISFRVPGGRTIAVVGPSGGGKSTLSRLLFRFYAPASGAIAVDGTPIDRVALASLRAAIGVVPQDTPLFNDTLAYNIAVGRPGCTQDEIEAAARLAEIDGFIRALPDGYDTVVGERGLKLSGGEKQRIAIARAILKRPRILVLDEATSALDTATERAIQRNLEAVTRDATTLIVAHRLSTVVHADEILVLERGRVVERGRHEALIARAGLYAAMWRRQQEGTEELDYA